MMDTIIWEIAEQAINVLEEEVVENDAIVLCEGDEYDFQEDRYVEFDDGA
jgi:hypothetical protein